MPFTHEQFLDVFGRYNHTMWPVVAGLWIVSAAALVWLLRSRGAASRAVAGLLAFHWLWSALAYHVAFFTAVNPGAWLFAALFLFEAACLFWLGVVRGRIRFTIGRTPRHVVGFVLCAYALLYPALSLTTGHDWPRAPVFAVPCPTTLLTIGLLLIAQPPLPLAAVIVPILWGGIGGSAANLLHVVPDYALLAAAAALAAWAVADVWTARSHAGKPSATAGR